MAIDFSVDPEFQETLDWIKDFVETKVAPLDHAFADEHVLFNKAHPVHKGVVRGLQQEVKDRDLWACHLGPELGGKGYGQVNLALMNEILGRSGWASTIFGTQAPDSGNAEILAHYGTDEHKEHYLKPLLSGDIASCYSMTEPDGGSDPKQFTCSAIRDGDDWIISGEKWFSSSLRFSAFAIVMVITNPDVPVYQGASMFLVPTDTPGVNILRHTGMGFDAAGEGNHAYVHYDDVRVPHENLLGGEGQAFQIAQTRLGGGRLHHGMRTVGAVGRCLDMMCERAVSRVTQGEPLAKKQMVQDMIAESWIELLQFRLQVLHAAWTFDQVGGAEARAEIAAVKVATAKVYKAAVMRAMQVNGSIGISNEMPLARMLLVAISLGLADGPSEVHKLTIARRALRGYEPTEGPWPSEHIPVRRAEAREQFAYLFEDESE